jgi:predicted ester cyclase
MALDENKAVVERFVAEFWSSGKLSTADELMAADATIAVNNEPVADIEALKAICRSFREAFPDWHSTFEELVVEGERVAERWTGRGTHRGEFQGIAATGRQVAVPGTVFYRIVGGKIAEFRGQFDRLAMLEQLGSAPMPLKA